MSDEENSKAPAQDVTSTDTDNEGNGTEDTGPRVFDITPDLNIAPAKDETESQPTLSVESAIPTTPINIINQPTNIPVTPTQIQEQSQPQTTVQQSQFGPANPPAKTVGMNRISPNNNIEQSKPIEPANLQEAVASIKINPDKTATTKPKTPEPQQTNDKPWLAKPDAKIRPLRTYETDFAEAMAKKRITTTSAIIAEEKKREDEPQVQTQIPKGIVGPVPIPFQNNRYQRTSAETFTPKKDIFKNVEPPRSPKPAKEPNPNATRNWILLLISIILVVGGSYAGYYLYKNSALFVIYPLSPKPKTDQPIVKSIDPNSLFQVDTKVKIAIDNKNENQILSLIRNEIAKNEKENSIKEIVLTKTIENITSKVDAKDMIDLLKIPAPDLLTRSISPEWMLGVYTGIGGQKNVFVVSTNNFFQNTFAGIIQWEKAMPEDLKTFIYSGTNGQDNNFTTSGKYKDRIIKNKDVREYVLENGHIGFLYSFISNDKLVMTNSEEALDEIIVRLEKNAYVR